MATRNASEEAAQPRVRQDSTVFPLSSKRLTSTFIIQIASAMGLPTRASAAEVLQTIEGSYRMPMEFS